MTARGRAPLATDAPASVRERERRDVRRLERWLRRTAWVRRVCFAGTRMLPSVVALLLAFLALYPLVFLPGEKLAATLASMVGTGLSFAGVSFSAAHAYADQPAHAVRLKTAGSMLLRFALAMAVALALASARERLAEVAGFARLTNAPLRVLTGVVTAAAIAMAFAGFQTLVLLLAPELEE